MQDTKDTQTATRPRRAIGTMAAVGAGVLAAAGLGAAAVGFTSTLSSSAPAPASDPCATVAATATPQDGENAALREGVECAILDSLVQKKIRRDIAQKYVTDVLTGQIDPAKLTGPQIAAIHECAVTTAQAAASAAMASGHGAAAVDAAATPSCIEAANQTGTR